MPCCRQFCRNTNDSRYWGGGERNLIPTQSPVNKVAIRDHLRQIGKEELWTEMQGYVYGARMDEALAYPGVIDFLSRATAAGDEVAIVSHKTKNPYLGT